MGEGGGDECSERMRAHKGEIEEKGGALSTGNSGGGNSPVGRGGGGGGGDVDAQACFVPGLAYFACLPGAEEREIEEESEGERDGRGEREEERERERTIKRGGERIESARRGGWGGGADI